MKKIICILICALLIGQTSSSFGADDYSALFDKIYVNKKVDPITGERECFASLQDPIQLSAHFKKSEVSLFFKVSDENRKLYEFSSSTLTYRVGSLPPATVEWRRLNSTTLVLDGTQAISLLKNIRTSPTLAVRFMSIGGEVTKVADMNGDQYKWQQILDGCK